MHSMGGMEIPYYQLHVDEGIVQLYKFSCFNDPLIKVCGIKISIVIYVLHNQGVGVEDESVVKVDGVPELCQ